MFSLFATTRALVVCIFGSMAIISCLAIRVSSLTANSRPLVVRIVKFSPQSGLSIKVQLGLEELGLQIDLADLVPIRDEEKNGWDAAGCSKECAGIECKLIWSWYYVDIVCRATSHGRIGTLFDRTHKATSHAIRKGANTGGNWMTGAIIGAREGVGAKELHSQAHQPLGMYQ